MTTDRALVLDFGGVISKTLFETHAESEQALGLPAGSLTWMGPFDPEHDALWRSMQDDEISEREYWLQRTREVGEMIGQRWDHMSQLLQATRVQTIDTLIRPEVRALVSNAKQLGVKLAVLSNELDLFYGAGFAESCRFLDDFDLILDATYTKVLKPDPVAYQHCAEALNLAPARCVFVDDQIRNVRGAIDAGMQAVHLDVKNPAVGFERAAEILKGESS